MAKVTFEEVKRRVEDTGHRLLSDHWVDAHTNLLIECQIGHTFERTLNNFNKVKECPVCKKSGKRTDRVNLSESLGIDTSKYLLSGLCKNGHDYENTGRSLWVLRNGNVHYCRQCNKEKGINRYLAHKEEHIEQARQRRLRESERWREYWRNYNLQNKAKKQVQKRAWYLLNKDKVRETTRKSKRLRRLRDPEGARLANAQDRHRRRARMTKNHSAYYGKEDLARRMSDFNDCCAYCGRDDRMTFDHFISVKSGGPDCIGNLIPACLSCNSGKCDRDPLTWYQKQSFFDSRRWRLILTILGKTEDSYTQIPLF